MASKKPRRKSTPPTTRSHKPGRPGRAIVGTSSKKNSPTTPTPPPTPPSIHPHHALEGLTSLQVLKTRELYWHNIVREMLNGLSIMCQSKPELFDGRFAILTRSRERIPIGSIYPLFACSIPNSDWELEASIAVQCTIFRVVTPDGEVFTLPIHEVRGLHSLTPELVEQLQKIAEAQEAANGSPDSPPRPFGLAAFTSLPKPPMPPFGPQGPESSL